MFKKYRDIDQIIKWLWDAFVKIQIILGYCGTKLSELG